MDIIKYEPTEQLKWNQFIKNSKNGTFLFERSYMDYHADRFVDFSLMIYEKNQLIALLPAHLINHTLCSHNGLTYGGFIIDVKMTVPKMLAIFNSVLHFLTTQQIEKLLYKTIPSIYHKAPAEEDKYALFLHGAKLFRRDVLSVVSSENRLPFQERRNRSIAKALKNNIVVQQTDDFGYFWDILTENLQDKHNTNPVHSLGEIKLLNNYFPHCIKLFGAYRFNEMLAGVLVYESDLVAHAQYISVSDIGRNLGALDLVFDFLLKEIYTNKKYFDFGISNENNGLYLNKGLIEQKEGFGARAIVHDHYEINLQ